MLIPAILVSIVALLAAMDEQLFGASMMARPLFTCPIIGLIMGDLQTVVIIGAIYYGWKCCSTGSICF